MANLMSDPHFVPRRLDRLPQVHFAPSPSSSAQRPARTRTDKENYQPHFETVGCFRPFTDPGMTSLQYRNSEVHSYLSDKTILVPRTYHYSRTTRHTFISEQPLPLGIYEINSNSKTTLSSLEPQLFHNPPQAPRSLCSSGSSATLIPPTLVVPVVDLTPKSRRKLAVEGLRKAASDAALRKIGLRSTVEWHNHPVSENKIVSCEVQPEQQPKPEARSVQNGPESSYSPRQYTPKPLLLPSKLARSSSVRSPSDSRRQSATSRTSRSTVHSPQRQLDFEEPLEVPPESFSQGANSTRSEQITSNSSVDHDITRRAGQTGDRCSTSSGVPILAKSRSVKFTRRNNAEQQNSCQDRGFAVEKGTSESYHSDQADGNVKVHQMAMNAFRWALAAPSTTKPTVLRRASAIDRRRQSVGAWLTPGRFQTRFEDSERLPSKSLNTGLGRECPQEDEFEEETQLLDESIEKTYVAQPVFLLPSNSSRSLMWENLRSLTTPRNNWDLLIKKLANVASPH